MSGALDSERHTRWTWVIAVLLILVLIALWYLGRGPGGTCCAATMPAVVVVPATQAMSERPSGALTFHVDAGKLVLEGVVPDAPTRDLLVQTATGVHGEGNVLDHLTLDAGKSVSRCVESIRLVFQSLKASPATAIACAGEKVVLSGKVDNDVDKLARGQIAADFFQGVQVENNIEVAASPN